MSITTTLPLSPDFEVLYFKQRQGENLKDAWYRLMEVYRTSNLKGDAKILLRNFYIGLSLHHRQLLAFSAKGSFIELDANPAYEILEGILGIPPIKKGVTFTQEGAQILDKLDDLHKPLIDVEKQQEYH